jgi:hypothetical protein
MKIGTFGKLLVLFALVALVFSAVPSRDVSAADPLASVRNVVVETGPNGRYAIITGQMPSSNWQAYRAFSVNGNRVDVTVYRRQVARTCPMMYKVTVPIPDGTTKLYINGKGWSYVLYK